MSADVAAFFDLDGTLLPAPSLERRFFGSLRANGAIPYSNYLLWAVEALRLLPSGLRAIGHANKRYLTGLNADLVLQHSGSLAFFEEGVDRVAWHARQFHQLVLVTGTLKPLAQLAAAALECELEIRGLQTHLHILATQPAESRGYWTGRLAGGALYGAAKKTEVRELADARQWKLLRCHGYGNSPLDAHFLTVVGHGHAVNPGPELAAIANRHDWPIWHWHQEKRLPARADSNCVSKIHSVEGQA